MKPTLISSRTLERLHHVRDRHDIELDEVGPTCGCDTCMPHLLDLVKHQLISFEVRDGAVSAALLPRGLLVLVAAGNA
jgi:hypothetical protein